METREFNPDRSLSKLTVDNRGTIKTPPEPDIVIDTYTVYLFDYYPTGEINTIRIREFDNLDKVISDKTLKHYKDAKQPEFL